MMMLRATVLAAALLGGCASVPEYIPAPDADFNVFYQALKVDVAARGLNPSLLDEAFEGTPAPVQEVLPKLAAQPEFTRTFAQYTGAMLSKTRIENGRQKYIKNIKQLNDIEVDFGVSSSVVVALWGIETNYGKVTGDHPIIPALATLSWKSNRPDFFRKELYAALEIAQKHKKNPRTLRGSWAGAMGQCQFMPTSYLAYAKDADGDGFADIWQNEADVLASAANYLKRHGWQANQPWRVVVTDELDLQGLTINSRGLSEPKPLSEWRRRGYTQSPPGFVEATPLRSYRPQPGGPLYLVGPNFSVILKWNNSSYFAYSVLALAEAIIPQRSAQPEEITRR